MFNYVSYDDDRPIKREVIPKKLYRQSDNWYVDAFDLNSGKWKTYQTRRIVGELDEKPASEIELNLLKKDRKESVPKTVKIKINQNAPLISHITGGNAIEESVIEFKYFDEKSFAKYILRFSSIIVNIDNELICQYYLDFLNEFMGVFSD